MGIDMLMGIDIGNDIAIDIGISTVERIDVGMDV
jgi:hypothetical protein